VIYYLMAANEWRCAENWPPPEARPLILYLDDTNRLTMRLPSRHSTPDSYTYEPEHPTPTIGGSIVSNVYTPGSVDVGEVQQRSDVLVYTTAPLERDLDVVGPVRLILHASSTAVDTDFVARISDVFPDGRAIQLQSGVLRARYRDLTGDPQLLEPGRVYRFEIDLWAIANRFKAGHSLRLDISSADFPRFDRNCNRGGAPGVPIAATQTLYHDSKHPSRLILMTIGGEHDDD
jgi:putative CocE/NonD family hydrolase